MSCPRRCLLVFTPEWTRGLFTRTEYQSKSDKIHELRRVR